ncbi:MAG TPA: T9SS type A sorting domain-containing protein [Cyclobacteriaceae bacterium]|nr:T9SS type A sorting domain-containing protein [Cyclobacteriaceae bacterium]
MKKMLSVLLSLIVVGCIPSLGSPFKGESKVSVVKKGEIFQVIYEAQQSSVFQVTISDEQGNKLFSEKIVGDHIARPYDFSQLPKGDYILNVQDQNSTQTQTICHHDKALIARLAKLKTSENSENKYMVTIPKQDDSDMMVSVFDQYDHLVYSEKAGVDQDFARIYNLKNLAGGSIQVFNKLSGETKTLKVE